jgi:hypothetical protein
MMKKKYKLTRQNPFTFISVLLFNLLAHFCIELVCLDQCYSNCVPRHTSMSKIFKCDAQRVSLNLQVCRTTCDTKSSSVSRNVWHQTFRCVAQRMTSNFPVCRATCVIKPSNVSRNVWRHSTFTPHKWFSVLRQQGLRITTLDDSLIDFPIKVRASKSTALNYGWEMHSHSWEDRKILICTGTKLQLQI